MTVRGGAPEAGGQGEFCVGSLGIGAGPASKLLGRLGAQRLDRGRRRTGLGFAHDGRQHQPRAPRTGDQAKARKRWIDLQDTFHQREPGRQLTGPIERQRLAQRSAGLRGLPLLHLQIGEMRVEVHVARGGQGCRSQHLHRQRAGALRGEQIRRPAHRGGLAWWQLRPQPQQFRQYRFAGFVLCQKVDELEAGLDPLVGAISGPFSVDRAMVSHLCLVSTAAHGVNTRQPTIQQAADRVLPQQVEQVTFAFTQSSEFDERQCQGPAGGQIRSLELQGGAIVVHRSEKIASCPRGLRACHVRRHAIVLRTCVQRLEQYGQRAEHRACDTDHDKDHAAVSHHGMINPLITITLRRAGSRRS